MNHTELLMRRRNVRAEILADPVTITVSRAGEPIKTAAGGYVQGELFDIAPQRARIIQNKRRYNPGIVNSEAGDIPHTDYLLLAEYNRDIEVDDRFIWRDEYYEVTGIYGARTESILATIDLLGRRNRDGQGR